MWRKIHTQQATGMAKQRYKPRILGIGRSKCAMLTATKLTICCCETDVKLMAWLAAILGVLELQFATRIGVSALLLAEQ